MIKKWDDHFPGGKCHLKAEPQELVVRAAQYNINISRR